jgi:5-methyltetrahydrofolate--homocysteine methyltransferase
LVSVAFFAGEEAKRVFNDAQALLKNIMNDNSMQCRGVVGFYRARSNGDDIELVDENGVVFETLFGIRQQVRQTLICTF